MNNLDLLNLMKEKSIGNKGKIKKEVKSKKITSKKLLASLFAVLLSISLCACDNLQFEKSEYEYDRGYVAVYVGGVDSRLDVVFRENGMERYQADNTIEEYQSIKSELKEDDIYIYHEKLGRKECEKICIVFGYEGLDDYLLKNGYVDENGNPDIYLLGDITYDRITKEMRAEYESRNEQELTVEEENVVKQK